MKNKAYKPEPNPKKIEQQKAAFYLGVKMAGESPNDSKIKNNPELTTLLNLYINQYWQSDLLAAYLRGFYNPNTEPKY